MWLRLVVCVILSILSGCKYSVYLYKIYQKYSFFRHTACFEMLMPTEPERNFQQRLIRRLSHGEALHSPAARWNIHAAHPKRIQKVRRRAWTPRPHPSPPGFDLGLPGLTGAYLHARSSCGLSGRLSHRWRADWSRARSRPATGGPGHPPWGVPGGWKETDEMK